MQIIVYHNPRCSKSRKTVHLLKKRNIKPQIRLYLKQPLDVNELSEILKKLHITPTELIRFGESVAKDLAILRVDRRDNKKWLELIANNPVLLQRPIVVNGDVAIIARPPEKVLDIL
jgi:arsenate reductase